jgi:hypothetical protein
MMKPYISFFYIIIVVFCFQNTSTAFQRDKKLLSTEKDIYSRQRYIDNAAVKFNINPRILAVTIFTERYLNYTIIDKELDFVLLDFGINASVGFAQVKPKTAEWIEKELNTPTEKGYMGKSFSRLLHVSTTGEIKAKLHSDSLNILYAAAYLAIFIKMWKQYGTDIHDNISLLATLYSHGYMDPHKLKPNSFGIKAQEFYYSPNILSKFR